MKITTKTLSALTMAIVLSAMTLHAAPDAKKSTPKPAPISFTDEQVQKMTKADVQKLTEKQIQALTPAQLLVVLPNFITTPTWCSDGRTTNAEWCGKYYGSELARFQCKAILPQQILGMTKAQLLAIPYEQFIHLDSSESLGKVLRYALAHNS